jgi:hypothetical protein
MQLPPFKWPLEERQWEQVYRKITALLAFDWGQVDKAGSSIADLTNKAHSLLTSILGWTSGTDTTQNKHISQADGTKWDEGADQAVLSLMTSYQQTEQVDISASLHMIKEPNATPQTDVSAILFTETKPNFKEPDNITGLYWMGG